MRHLAHLVADKKKRASLIVLIAAVAVGLQLVIMFVVIESPNTLFWSDSKEYMRIATELARGEPYSTPGESKNIYRTPGYPFVLSLLVRALGPNVLVLRLIHIAFFCLFLWLLYALGARFAGPTAGLIAMLLGAVYPLLLYLPLALYPESLMLTLYAAIALLILHIRERFTAVWALVLGVAIGAACLLRATAVIWIPTALFYVLWKAKRRLRDVVILSAAVVVIPLIAIASWMIRNHAVHGMYVFSTAASSNLLSSYNERATGIRPADERAGLPEEITQELDQAQNEAEIERIKMRAVRRFIVNNPWRAFKTACMQCVDTWSPIPRTMTQGGMADVKFKLINAFTYGPLLLLGLVGCLLSWKHLLTKSIVILCALNTVANGIAGMSIRYRAVTDFGFLLLAAYAIDRLLSRFTSAREGDRGSADLQQHGRGG